MTTLTEREALIARLRVGYTLHQNDTPDLDAADELMGLAADMLEADAREIARLRNACDKFSEAELQAQQVAVPQGECWPEDVMQQWDYWRKEIAEGDRSSAPRDWFESLAELLATESQQVAVPQGWKLVPMEPNDCMMLAGIDESPLCVRKMFTGNGTYTGEISSFTTGGCADIYKAMLAAAPQPPQAEQVAKDAARYQWLKAHCKTEGNDGDVTLTFTCDFENYDDLDASIDAAINLSRV